MSQPRRSISRASGTRHQKTQQPNVDPVMNLEVEEQHEQYTEVSQAESTPTTQAPRQLKSTIFTKHFKKIPIEGDDSNMKVVCNYCSKDFKFKKNGGYGTFNKHMKEVHPNEWGIDRTQQQLQGTSSTNATDIFKFDHNKWRDELAKCISVQHLPFNYGENPTFINMIQQTLQPAAKKISRNTVKRTILKLYKDGQNSLKNYFTNSNGKFSICCDIWSDHWQTHSYMGVTCHWVDDDYFLQKRLIAYRVFDEQHNAQNIAMLLNIIFQEYGLVKKIFSISFDNASSNTASIPELEHTCKPSFGGKFFHIRCTAHVLNLCVQDGLRDLSTHLHPIKSAINLIWTYNNIRKEWGKFCKDNGKRPKKFPRDVPTRWNSTYRLLHDCFEYKDLLSNFLLINYRTYYFDSNVWDSLYKILNVLNVFNNATERLSGVYYATSHLVLPECVNIAYILKQLHDDPDLRNVSVSMKIKWCKYFKDIPLLNLVAVVLDPRIKLDGLEEYLGSYYSCLTFDDLDLTSDEYSADLRTIASLMLELGQKDISVIVSDVKRTILELLGENNSASNVAVADTSSSSSGGFLGLFGKGKSLLSHSDIIMQERLKRPKPTYNSTMELDFYLSIQFNVNEYTNREFDVLTWWKEHAHQLPVLATIARGILGCPVSTVAVEQAFSAGGNILTETRSMLTPTSLEAQVCLDDWTKAETRSQGQAHLADYDQFDLSSEGTITGDSDREA